MKLSDESMRVWADADFSGNWNQDEAMHNADTARSRSGFIITFLGCPILWKSQLQTEIALSSTEAEYVSLSQALRKAIPLIEIIKELEDRKFVTGTSATQVRCKLFEDNSGALTLAKAPAMRPRTKHINTKYHHFRTYVARNEVVLEAVGTLDQWADMLTKPNTLEDFHRHRKAVMGW